jgi:mono/diheme cytochrome c family protein
MRIGNRLLIDARSPLRGWRRRSAWLAMGLVIGLAGCRKDMYDQPKYEAYDPSASFADGTSSRQLVSGTVARGQLRADTLYYEGKTDGKDADVFPFPIDAELLEMGRERYTIFCSPCHGQQGNGKGMVVRRGFSPPPDLHAEYLRKIPVGHFYNVITHGYGAMYSYEARIPVKQRWAIAAYIRALQYSQDAQRSDLTAEELKKLAEAEKASQPTPVVSKSLVEAHQ